MLKIVKFLLQIIVQQGQKLQKSEKMFPKSIPQTSALMLQSQIKEYSSNFHPISLKSIKSLNHNYQNIDIQPLSLHRCKSQNKIMEGVSQCQRSTTHWTGKTKFPIKQSTQISKSNQIEVSRLKEEKDILQRNFTYEVEFYVRERMKDLLTIHQLLIANQIQRVQKYVQTQLNHLRKLHQIYISEDSLFKPTITKDMLMKFSMQEDSNYNQLISNLISNMKQFQIGNKFQIPLMKKLGNQAELTTKKLAWYLEQVPFEMPPNNMSKSLAIKLIGELGISDGRKILDFISKSVQQKSKGKFKLYIQQPQPKSQMSKLIEQHSNSRVKINKLARDGISSIY